MATEHRKRERETDSDPYSIVVNLFISQVKVYLPFAFKYVTTKKKKAFDFFTPDA